MSTPIKIMDISEILKILPHRYPFLLVDKAEIIEAGHGIGIKCVTMNEEFFQGHFPSNPVMPGVLIIEAMAQTAGIVVGSSVELKENQTFNVYFMTVDEVKFRKMVRPGDVLRMKVVKENEKMSVWKFKGEAFVDNVLVASAKFSAMMTIKDN